MLFVSELVTITTPGWVEGPWLRLLLPDGKGNDSTFDDSMLRRASKEVEEASRGSSGLTDTAPGVVAVLRRTLESLLG